MTFLSYFRRPGPGQTARVYLYGGHSDDWMRALSLHGKVWTLLPWVHFGDVVMDWDRHRLFKLPPFDGRTVVLPLMERHMRTLPPLHHALVPDTASLIALSDKLAFAHYAQSTGLGALVPESYDIANPRFPAVLKRVNFHGGYGVDVVRSAADLNRLLEDPLWQAERLVLQEFIGGSTDYVTHAVLKRGRLLWSKSYVYQLTKGQYVQRLRYIEHRAAYWPDETTLSQLMSFLTPLDYSGPVAFDYRFDANGCLKVLEINPRLGGSLMRPENIEDLRAALTTIIEHAEPRA